MRSWQSKLTLAVVAIVLVLVIAFLAQGMLAVTASPQIYLAEGGLGCLVIKRKMRGWQIEKEYISQDIEHRAVSVGRHLRIENRTTPDVVRRMGLEPEVARRLGVEAEWKLILVLERSPSRRGDWDLIAYCNRIQGVETTPPAAVEPYPLKKAIPFLHRLNDARVVEYFDLQYEAKNPTAAYETARQLLAPHPQDPYVRALYLSAAAHCDDTSEVARRVAEWKGELERTGDPFVLHALQMTVSWLRARQLSAAGQNAWDFYLDVLGPKTDLPARLRLLPKIFNYEDFVPPTLPKLYGSVARPIELQVSAKVFGVIATFWMLEGKRGQSLELAAATYHLGQTLMPSGMLVPQLIGVAVRTIADRSLQLYVLNCCETEADFQTAWAMLERLKRSARPPRWRDLLHVLEPLNEILPQETTTEPIEWDVRGTVADSRFELVRMATAAKHRVVSSGRFPESGDQFAPLLAQGLPKDPFSTGPLRFVPRGESLFCYSVGPDKRDDRATVEYDPTNGVLSQGDIWVEVPRKRQYPFTRDGVRAKNEEDLARQFPNGLPPDPFASTKGKPFGTTTSITGDLYVYSYGPDVDQWKHGVWGADTIYPSLQPMTTMGVISWTTRTVMQPSYTYTLQVNSLTSWHIVTTTAPTMVVEYSLTSPVAGFPPSFPPGLPGALPPPEPPNRPPPHVLEPPYDPTNGLMSEGDLFIRIPKP